MVSTFANLYFEHHDSPHVHLKYDPPQEIPPLSTNQLDVFIFL